MSDAERYVAETTFHVRYAETDAMGIVHHASFIVYFEEGRSSYARQRGSDYANFERSGRFLAVTEVNARYVKPAVYGQRITIRCWIRELRSRSVTFEYELFNPDTGDVHVTGYTKHMAIKKDGSVTTIPDDWRAWGA